LTDDGERVTLSLQDNGRGFNADEVERRVGHGLMNMRDRAAALGGELTYHSSTGQGAEVRVSFPKQPAC
jgi:signal transduction histidine kinase